ncbi:MAG: hypothetical protein ACJAXK_001756 [Yoonia sp.]|jgi:hypothetical protein
MRNMKFEQRQLSRRRTLTTTLAVFCGLFAADVCAGNESTEMNVIELINALRSVGTPVCVNAADALAASVETGTGFDLHLRSAGLNEAAAQILAHGMRRSDVGNGRFLRSFSASYNPDLGDVGAAALAEAFPDTMIELGLVGCSIGDAGGSAILEWARKARQLRMICVEGNMFSAEIKSQFQSLASHGREILVVV